MSVQDMLEESAAEAAEEKEDQDDGMTDFALMESGSQFGSELGASILMPSVDPLVWREETERVGPKLAQAQKQALNAMSGGWGQHLEMMKTYKEKNLPGIGAPSSSSSLSESPRGNDVESKSGNARDRIQTSMGASKTGAGISGGSASETAGLIMQLSGLQRDLQDTLGGLGRAERLLNSKSDMQQLAEKYQEHKKVGTHDGH